MKRFSIPNPLFCLSAMLLLAISVSCNNDGFNEEEPTADCYPLVIKRNGKPIMEFSYDEEYRPVEIKEYSNGSLSQRAVLEYNSDGQKASLQYYDADDNPLRYLTYDYNERQLLARTTFYIRSQDGGFTKQKHISFWYNQDREMIKEYHYLVSDSSSLILSLYHTYTYNSAGNISIRRSYDSNGEFQYVYNYEYDDGHQPYVLIPFFYNLGNLYKNNIIKSIKSDKFNNILSDSYNSSYTYNKYNYPVEEDRKFFSTGTLQNYEIQYMCNE